MRGIVKVLVRCFQKTEVEPIHGFFGHQVSAEENAIGKTEEKSARGIRLPPEFRRTCTDVEHHVGMLLQQSRGATQVFSALGYVRRDESSLWMTRNDPITLIKKFCLGELRAVKAPVRVRCQFLVAFVARINRQEEGVGIRDMEHDRNAQFRRLVKDGRQAVVIYAQQLPLPTAPGRSQVLPKLDSPGAMPPQPLQPV